MPLNEVGSLLFHLGDFYLLNLGQILDKYHVVLSGQQHVGDFAHLDEDILTRYDSTEYFRHL